VSKQKTSKTKEQDWEKEQNANKRWGGNPRSGGKRDQANSVGKRGETVLGVGPQRDIK